MNRNTHTKSVISTAFFAAVIFLGIQSFRIPLPAAVGTPFLHFGHIFVMMAIVCLGAKRSMVAAVLGYLIFDLLNGYVHAIPNVLVTTVIKCLFIGVIYAAFEKKAAGDRKKESAYAILCAVIYGVTNIFLDFVWAVVELVLIGNTLGAAIAAEITSIPATIINAVFTVVGTAILYVPVKNAYSRILK